ncbi:16S rRNA (guanine(966)-N(2))-methyltransferase RsmD [sulfur-oxidizing endosymbiont of Gigantopelta aegis]|uniref:16S rRNA (guanine(966)-N(2))-methyltransferase RsmD n=1 Tax=sulfur-oxidizing endosymbiont of Gigantopelta aegis TaxID=2794934 RepID=UPI001FE83CB7|nr:16S rRNA (guanine(966)-N(2))-methyltransferase RsmD [sulfur-oxidizing endosymbiont of Gigantopelta aegis]
MQGLKRAKAKSGQSNQLRIIGGQWRGRKLNFADGEGLRPTMDRVRETLFNWLQADIVGARCLDLFSGSGALGLEALSRYAAEVVMIDKNPQAIQMIRQNLALLQVENAQLIQTDAKAYLQSHSLQKQALASEKTFDIVFLDPPFNQHLVPVFCGLLQQSQCLSDKALIYIEVEKNTPLPPLPNGWTVLKEKKTGQLAYFLINVHKK